MGLPKGFRAIVTPLAPGGASSWQEPNAPHFIRAAVRPFHDAGGFPLTSFPGWFLYGGPLPRFALAEMFERLRAYAMQQGFAVWHEALPIAPPQLQAWPHGDFRWSWQWDTAVPARYRLTEMPITAGPVGTALGPTGKRVAWVQASSGEVAGVAA